MNDRQYVKHSFWQPTGPWEKVAIKSKLGGKLLFTREERELDGNKVYILKDGERYRWAGLDRCLFYSETVSEIFPKDKIPELE